MAYNGGEGCLPLGEREVAMQGYHRERLRRIVVGGAVGRGQRTLAACRQLPCLYVAVAAGPVGRTTVFCFGPYI